MSPSIRTMGFFMSEINFCNTQQQLVHLGEVITGKTDGSPTGADIETSTLPYTGQVRKTLPALEGEYEQSITDKEAEADAVIDAYRLLSKGDYTSGILLNNKFEFIEYNGASYFALNPPYTTTSTTPDSDGNLFISGYATQAFVEDLVGLEVVDLVISCGQSNGEGRGDVYSSPDAPNGLYIDGSSISSLQDPVGGATNGSMWPSFANEWHNQTGNLVAIVDQSTGGTALTNGGAWSPSGSLRAAAVSAATSAISAIESSDSYKLGKIYFHWLQGESDADIGGVSESEYEAALIELADYFKSQVTDMDVMLVSTIGRRGNGAGSVTTYSDLDNDTNAIIKAQHSACVSSSNLRMTYFGSSSMLPDYNVFDGTHFSQEALNTIGKGAAKLAHNDQPSVGFKSNLTPFLNSGSFIDPTTTSKTSAQLTHECHYKTQSLVVVVASNRIGSGTFYTHTASFDGADMKLIGTVRDHGASAGTTVSVFCLTDKDYGRRLRNVEGVVEVTASSNQSVINFSVIDLQGVDYSDTVTGYALDGSAGLSQFDIENQTYTPALVITGGCFMGQSASPVTLSGSGFTEDGNGSISNGTEVASFISGHYQSNAGEGVSQSVTSSESQELVSLISCVFRNKIYGEF